MLLRWPFYHILQPQRSKNICPLQMDASNLLLNSFSVGEQQQEQEPERPILTEWIGMGRSGPFNLAKLQLWNWICLVMLSLCLLFRPVYCQTCRIQRCNAEYVASFSPSGGLQEEVLTDVDHCIALRAYSLCTRRTARGCRGDLVYHSAVFRIKELFAQHNCSSDGPTSSAKAPSTSRPAVVDVCDYESRALASGPAAQQKKYGHCGLFGDPHLRTFRDEFQTCRVEGAWPLIHNRYLSVQVTNVPVVEGSSATATNKITVIFKSYHDCTEQKVYQATTEDLPSAFQDGTRSGGKGGSLYIVEDGSRSTGGRQVMIQARYLGASIIVRQVGRYLTFAIRIPEELAEENGGLQLCLHGCPRSEVIKAHVLTRQHGLRPPRLLGSWYEPEEEDGGGGELKPGLSAQKDMLERATTKCRETLQVEDVYFQSCVFDILTTGDLEFSMAAYGALEDLKALPPSTLKQSSPRTPHIYNGATTASSSLFVALILVFLFC
ncbi:RGM domain family, member D [Astyanax mexicanus]|uniref:RGM domain family, member D n=1 Tax=Astyanax mexicanus TaxID=7994 RepID=A0A3B1K9R9_ASTMX|nr:RGM domain family, member D [Astyanax mexicanus]XP_049321730.1 RGM domain family, member D [Astyanax mexicanus]